MLAETYMQLLGDPAHWWFELTLIVIFDGILGVLVWPRIKAHFHQDDHNLEQELIRRIEELETHMHDDMGFDLTDTHGFDID